MSGPPYPPVPTDQSIGKFKIGVSPIGSIEQFVFWTTIISQYANSPILAAMIQSFNDANDQIRDLDNFFDMIWNVQTAQGIGLDIWGRIVGVTRSFMVPGGTGAFLGFQEAGDTTHDLPFGQAPFFTGSGSSTGNTTLSDTSFRTLILAKALANINSGSITAINAVLLALFPNRGAAFVTDGLNMTMTYTFQFSLSMLELAIVQFSGILPRPAGVSVTVVHP